MRDKYKKIYDKLRSFFVVDNLALIVVLVVATIWMIGTISVLNQNYALQRQVDQGELNNQIIKLQNQNLQLQQSYFKTDEFLGLEARALLGKANAGEHLVLLPKTKIVSNTTSKPSSTSTQTTQSNSSGSNFSQWMKFLFGGR